MHERPHKLLLSNNKLPYKDPNSNNNSIRFTDLVAHGRAPPEHIRGPHGWRGPQSDAARPQHLPRPQNGGASGWAAGKRVWPRRTVNAAPPCSRHSPFLASCLANNLDARHCARCAKWRQLLFLSRSLGEPPFVFWRQPLLSSGVVLTLLPVRRGGRQDRQAEGSFRGGNLGQAEGFERARARVPRRRCRGRQEPQYLPPPPWSAHSLSHDAKIAEILR